MFSKTIYSTTSDLVSIDTDPKQVDKDWYGAVPQELKDHSQWVMCCLIWSDKKQKVDKVPFHPRGHRAAFTSPDQWSPYAVCLDSLVESAKPNRCPLIPRYHLIGFVVDETDEYTAFDLDHCIKPTGEIEEWALKKLNRLN